MPTLVRRLGLFLLVAVPFALTCWQAPLYYSNQNQYFLNGMAAAGVGHLSQDWLANTLDPTPVFSALVAFTARYLHPWAFHIYYGVVQGVYAVALLGVFFALADSQNYLTLSSARRWPVFLALLFLVHAAVVRWGSYQWLGQDYAWYLQSGVAGQYTLGAMFQPSTFGVLLVAAVALLALDRPYLAAVCAALGATVHSTYLLHAGMLVLGFQVALLVEGRRKTALGAGALALVLVLPAAVYVWRTFSPSDAIKFELAQQILVDVRIPHHARIDKWLDPIAWLQIAWIALGIALAGRRLAVALGVAALIAAALTITQAVIDNNTLALLFPWRLSAILVPVATAVILSRLVLLLPSAVEGISGRAVCGIVIVLCVVGGLWVGLGRRGFHASDEELPLMAWVRDNAKPGDVYFIPFTVPDLLKMPPGSRSSDFRPLVEKKHGTQVIPIDLQRFRLHTGAPIHVDFKSIPYKDEEVLEWALRIDWARRMQERLRGGGGNAHDAVVALRTYGSNHLVLPAGQQLPPGMATEVYKDEHYRVYQLKP